MKKKTVNGWAVADELGIPILVGNALAVYSADAKRLNHRLIPVDITYSLPKKK